MARTFEDMIADRGGRPFLYVIIDSIGDASGHRKFTDRKPTQYSDADFSDVLAARPNIEPQISNPLGGVAAQSELSIELVDVEDEVSAFFRTDARAQTRLSATIAVGDSQATLVSLSGITAGTSIIFVGREAMLVTSVVVGTTVAVTRGFLGTEAQRHLAGRPVYLYTPSIYGRRMRLYLGFDDEGCDATTEEEIGGGWSIDTIELGEGLNSWVLQGRSQLKHLDRLLYRAAYRGVLQQIRLESGIIYTFSYDTRAAFIDEHFGDSIFLQIGGKEIIRVAPDEIILNQVAIELRGVAGTLPAEWSTDDEVRQVFVADREDDRGSFRYQDPHDETDLRSDPWTPTDHPVPIMLALLTSWSSINETQPTNWVDGSGNYSGLPAGIGLGVPIALIDYDSFLDVWFRTQNFRLPYLTLREPVVGRELIDKQICRVCGYDLLIRNGQIALSYFRSPLEGEAATTWDDSVLLTRENENGDRRPLVSVRMDTEFTAGAVVFTAKTSRGDDVESVFTDQSFPEYFGDADGYYESEDQRIEIEAAGVRVDAAGNEPELLKHRALQLLYRYRRPLMRIEVATDLSQEKVEPGQILYLTHEQIPNLITGTRGVTNLICRVLVKGGLELSEEMCGRRWTLIAYGAAGRFGRVSPSAMINDAPTSAGGGNYNAPIEENRYTDPNARGIANTDGEAWTAGDRARLTTRGGLPIATTPAYQTVVSVAADNLVLDGNFGGSASFTTGTIIAYVNRDDTTNTQANNYVHMADNATRTVGATAQTAWSYGEP